MGMGNENGNENGIVPPVPGDGDDTTWGPPTTFSHEGVLLQKSSTSKNVFGWSPLLPIQQKYYQEDSNNDNLGESNMIMEKVINDLWKYI